MVKSDWLIMVAEQQVYNRVIFNLRLQKRKHTRAIVNTGRPLGFCTSETQRLAHNYVLVSH